MYLSFKEDHISQLPALMLLQKLGYTYLSQEEALLLRSEKTTNVLLEPILREQLRIINSIPIISGKIEPFSEQNIENGIEAMRMYQCKKVIFPVTSMSITCLHWVKLWNKALMVIKKVIH